MYASKYALGVLITALVAAPRPSVGEEISVKELYALIQKQQQQIEELQGLIKNNDSRIEETVVLVAQNDMKIEATALQVESTSSKLEPTSNKNSIGAYGELHYNNLNGQGGASDKDELDYHRFVLFYGHEFSNTMRFFSELEVEHSIAGDGKVGEIELEQAYVEMDFNDKHGARLGMMLSPVGILNETHEPPTFYGTERNPIEKDIVPATWWFGGVSVFGELAPGWSYDLALHEGLNTSAAAAYKPRSGRQKTGKAKAEDLALTGRIKWTGRPGVELAATVNYQSDITQGSDPTAGDATLIEAHGIYSAGQFTVKALYANWNLEGSGPKAIGADKQEGWYIEPSYRFNEKLGVFVRWNQWDNAAGNGGDSEKGQLDFGLNWWPHPNVVIKADYQKQDNDNGKDQDGINLGVGYMW